MGFLAMSSSDRGFQTFVCRPSITQSGSNSYWANSEVPSPFSDSLCNSFVGNVFVRPFIVALLCLVRPSAVVGRVRAIIVDAVKRFALGRVSHVFVKRGKRVAPGITNGDPSLSVVYEFFVKRLMTTVYHRLPGFVGGRAGQSMSHFYSETPTRMPVVSLEVVGLSDNHISAATDAQPICGSTYGSARGLSGWCDSKQPTENLKRQILRFFAKWYYLVRHFGISSIECLGRAMGGNPSFC